MEVSKSWSVKLERKQHRRKIGENPDRKARERNKMEPKNEKMLKSERCIAMSVNGSDRVGA